jgi:hypothetical protein
MGRRSSGNPIPQKTNNSINDLVVSEKNEYPVPDPYRTMINITNELSDTYKKNLSKRKLWKRSLRNSWRSYKMWLTKNYKMHLRTTKTPQIKTLRRHRNN